MHHPQTRAGKITVSTLEKVALVHGGEGQRDGSVWALTLPSLEQTSQLVPGSSALISMNLLHYNVGELTGTNGCFDGARNGCLSDISHGGSERRAAPGRIAV